MGEHAQWFTIDEFLDMLMVLFPDADNTIETSEQWVKPGKPAHAVWSVQDRHNEILASGQAVIEWSFHKAGGRMIGGSRYDGMVLV